MRGPPSEMVVVRCFFGVYPTMSWINHRPLSECPAHRGKFHSSQQRAYTFPHMGCSRAAGLRWGAVLLATSVLVAACSEDSQGEVGTTRSTAVTPSTLAPVTSVTADPTTTPGATAAPSTSLITVPSDTSITMPSDTPPTSGPWLQAIELQAEDPMPGGQFVIVANAGAEPADLGCWRLESVATGVALFLPPGTDIGIDEGLRVVPEVPWLATEDTVRLVDSTGQLVDNTPALRDESFDDQLWVRDVAGEWRFGRPELPSRLTDAFGTVERPASC